MQSIWRVIWIWNVFITSTLLTKFTEIHKSVKIQSVYFLTSLKVSLKKNVYTWLSCTTYSKPSRSLLYFLSLYFLRMKVARCSVEAPMWSSSSKGRLAAQKLLAFLFPTSRKNYGMNNKKKHNWDQNLTQTHFFFCYKKKMKSKNYLHKFIAPDTAVQL